MIGVREQLSLITAVHEHNELKLSCSENISWNGKYPLVMGSVIAGETNGIASFSPDTSFFWHHYSFVTIAFSMMAG
jgi:hypothetical protein